MRRVIRRLDRFLSNQLRIFTFCEAEDCLLRLQITESRHEVELAGTRIEAGEPILAIHFWNEHLPEVPSGGSDVVWARRMGRLMFKALYYLGEYLSHHPELIERKAIYGATALFSPYGRSGSVELMHRFGFSVLPYQTSWGWFGEFWENFYAWWVLWAYSPASLRHRWFWSMRRSEVWMLTEEFMKRYGKGDRDGR